jgi:sarcosine oxidase/L-pipecolate oxidase
MLSLEDARNRWDGVFKTANWDGAEEIYWNPNSGLADAEGALGDTIQGAISKGVKYRDTTVSTLILDVNRACTPPPHNA